MQIKHIDIPDKITPKDIPSLFDCNSIEWTAIDRVNWRADYPYKPDVAVRIAHAGDKILLHYSVRERDLRAVCDCDNGRSWEDSCVEFFLQPDSDQPLYYNFEFTCAGFKLVGGGDYGTERGRAPMEIHSKVQTWSSLGHEAFGQQHGEAQWQLAAIIPVEALYLSSITHLDGLSMRGNFYKCGDLQPTPHFLSWTEIRAPKPQFHLPQFFGNLEFEKQL